MTEKKKNLKSNESENFICSNCKKRVSGKALGTKQRNHCFFCLYSLHVDINKGDRNSDCGGLMSPLGLSTKKDGEIIFIHRCLDCGKVSKNRIAGDDDVENILSLCKGDIPEVEGCKFVKSKGEVKDQLLGRKAQTYEKKYS